LLGQQDPLSSAARGPLQQLLLEIEFMDEFR
jgi:hypothetical protein